MKIGNLAGLSLADARQEHQRQRAAIENNGVTPRMEQAAAAAEKAAEAAEAAAGVTVKALAADYIARWAKRRKKSWLQDQQQLERDVIPRWGDRRAADVTRRDVVALLDEVVGRGAPIAANRLLAVVRRMFRWSVEVGILENTPCLYVKAPAAEHQKDRVLSEEEIRAAWEAWSNAGATPTTRRALQFMLATAQRPGEVQSITWAEIAGTWWTISAAKSKNKQAHRVHLNALALEALGERGKGYVFKGRGGAMSPRALARACARHAKLEATPIQKSRSKGIRKRHKLPVVWGVERFSPHDLRRTAASHMTGSGISRLVVSKILNHVETGVTAVYDRHSYDLEKVQALDAWARKLRQIVEGEQCDNVVEFPTANGTN